MKATSIVTALALALLPTASAWHLQLYRAELYKDVIEDREGTLSQPCKNLVGSRDNAASSMKWDAGFWIKCGVELYERPDCINRIGASGKSDWNIPRFSNLNNNKLSSYQIFCWTQADCGENRITTRHSLKKEGGGRWGFFVVAASRVVPYQMLLEEGVFVFCGDDSIVVTVRPSSSFSVCPDLACYISRRLFMASLRKHYIWSSDHHLYHLPIISHIIPIPRSKAFFEHCSYRNLYILWLIWEGIWKKLLLKVAGSKIPCIGSIKFSHWPFLEPGNHPQIFHHSMVPWCSSMHMKLLSSSTLLHKC